MGMDFFFADCLGGYTSLHLESCLKRTEINTFEEELDTVKLSSGLRPQPLERLLKCGVLRGRLKTLLHRIIALDSYK